MKSKIDSISRVRAKELIDWQAGMNQAATHVIIDKIKENAAAGIGSFGQHFSKKDGKPVHWKMTGDLLDSMQAYTGGKISIRADYASFVNAKFPFVNGFSAEDKADIANRMKPIMVEAYKHNRRL